MIVASLLLVIVAAMLLLVGLLNRDTIEWVYGSIACCLVAGVLLTIGVLRSRPSRKPVPHPADDRQDASWAGATPGPAFAGGPEGDDEPTRTDVPTADDGEPWSPWARRDTDDELNDDAARFEQALSPIAGVGPAKRRALHDHFGSYRELLAASPEAIAGVPGISPTLAGRIHTALHREPGR